MKKWQLTALGLGILLADMISFRGSRVEPGMFLVTESRVDGDQMVAEYRMSQPFEVSLHHGVRKPMVWPGGPGIHVGGNTTLRTDKVEFVASEYDISSRMFAAIPGP